MSDEDTTTVEKTPTQTLEEIASEFQVKESATPQTPPPVQQPQMPEFSDPEAAALWSAKQIQEINARDLSRAQEDARNKQASFVEKQVQALNGAVETISKEVPISKTFIEGSLHVKYNRDPNFRTIFDNRDRNPAAFQKALGVIAQELKTEASVSSNPQVAEDARALEQLTKSARAGRLQDDPMEKYKGMSAAQFDQEWEKIRSG